MHINLPLIIGLASGFALVNVILVLTWCLCRRRKSKADHMQRSVLRRNRLQLRVEINSLQSEKYDRYPVSPQRHSSEPQKYTPSVLSLPPNQRRAPLEILGLRAPLRTQLAVPAAMGITRAASTRSDGSASIYSTVSAPIHLHEELLRSPPISNTISTYKVDVPGYSTMDTSANGSKPSARPLVPRHRLSVIEELMPETYTRNPQWSRYPSDTPLKSDDSQGPLHTLSHTPKQPRSSPPLHLMPALVTPPREARPALYGRASSSYLPSPYSPPLGYLRTS